MATSHKPLTSPQPVDGAGAMDGAADASRYSRLRLAAASPDWMSSLAQPQSPSGRAAPAPVASTAAATTAPRGGGFLSMFYRSGGGGARAESAGAAPEPPIALGGPSTPPLRAAALPIDVALSLDAATPGSLRTAEVRAAAPAPAPRHRDPLRAAPMALGSETWNALGGAAVARSITKPARVTGAPGRVAPAPIDAALPSSAPRPLWVELPAAATTDGSGGASRCTRPPQPLGVTAPTLEAFRRAPEPPRPLTTSPLREESSPTAMSSVAPAPLLVAAPPRGLRPVGEEDEPVTPVVRSGNGSGPTAASAAAAVVETGRAFLRGAHVRRPPTSTSAGTVNPFAGLSFATMVHNESDSGSDEESLALGADLSAAAAVERRASSPPPLPQTVAAQSFFSTLFAGGSPTVSQPAVQQSAPAVSKSATARMAEALMSFNALELATGSRSKSVAAAPVASQPQAQDYSAYFSKAFEELDEDGEESLDDLKRVVSIVMQSARQQQQQQQQQSPSSVDEAGSSVTAHGCSSDTGKGGRPSSGDSGNNTFRLFRSAAETSVSTTWARPASSAMLHGM